MDTIQGLDLLQKLEEGLAGTYASLNEKFSDDGDLAAFFYQLHLEEIAHANIVKMQKRIVRKDPALFPSIEINASEVNKVLDVAASVAKMSKERLPEILKMIYTLESSSAELYVFTALAKANSSVMGLMLQLGAGFSEHLALVESMLNKQDIPFNKIEGLKLRHPRVIFSQNVLVNDKVSMKAFDISESGMFLLTDKKLAVGNKVALSFTLDKERVTAKAVVQFVDEKRGIGVEFYEVRDEHRALINAYVNNALEHKQAMRRPVLLVSSTFTSAANMRIYTNALLEADYVVTFTQGFVEAVLYLNAHNEEAETVVVSIGSAEDTNMKLLQYIDENKLLGKVNVFVLTNNFSPDFKEAVERYGVKAVLPVLENPPNKLAAKIKSM